jgi:hypothetical protein
MIETWKEEWFGPFRQRCAYWECRRGFMDEIHLDVVTFVTEAEEVFPLHPIRIVRLVRGGDVTPRELAECPHLAFVTTLGLSRGFTQGTLREEGVLALAGSPHLTRVRTLELAGVELTAAGARALAESPALPRLASLNLAGNEIGAEGLRALLTSPLRTSLVHLDVSGSWYHGQEGSSGRPNVGNDGALVLASCPQAARLRTVNLRGNGLTPDGVAALAGSPYLRELARLEVERSGLGDDDRDLLQERFGERLAWAW